MPSFELLSECEKLTHIVRPDWADVQVYPLNVPDGYRALPETVAFTVGGYMDFMIQKALIEEGRLNGPGVVVVFCRESSREETLGAMLHEIAHDMRPISPFRSVPTEEDKVFQRNLLAVLFQSKREHQSARKMPRWYPDHDIRFTRRCLHLHHRAWEAGYEVGLPQIMFAGWMYELSHPWQYRDALGDEPHRMLEASFVEIDAEPVPEPFKQLWNEDFQKWCNEHHSTNKVTENES